MLPPVRRAASAHGLTRQRERVRVACVHGRRLGADFAPRAMNEIRFLRMAEALARRGHEVDLVLDGVPAPRVLAADLREVPYGAVRWADYDVIKTFFHFAAVGLVLAQGPVQDNDSSKVYYYLRSGLPVVCESPVPNAWLVRQTGHGAIVDYDDVEAFATAAADLALRPPPGNGVAQYMVESHSWDVRAAAYDPVFAAARTARA